jgi:uncharacterized protein (TIGR03435 family)
MVRNTATAILIALIPSALWSQTPLPRPTFEVASVKPNNTRTRGGSMDFAKGGERFTVTNMPLGALILVAYDITVRQLSGSGESLSDKYDIAAKAEHPTRPSEMLQMIQSLLADRFKFQFHWENRDTDVYALTVVKGGVKLRPSSPPDDGSGAFRIPSRAGGTEPASGHLVFKNESMPDFAWALSRMGAIGDRVVVDNTGLDGAYDFELKFVPSRPPAQDSPDLAAQPEGPSIFSALEEQLGLKLVAKRAPVAFLVIDHLERPSAN